MYLRLSPYLDILHGVLTSLQINEGIIKITGKSGAGKTALCSQLFNELQSQGQPVVFFLQAPAGALALQNEILEKLKLDPSGNFTRTLTAYLLARSVEQKPLVLIFDDAQQLDPQTFSAIRMLCNIQDRSRGLVRVVLCGTDELDQELATPALRAVTQFLSQSFTLTYLTQEQVGDFCQGYWMAMNDEMKPLDDKVLEKLYTETRGHPGILQARLTQGTTGAERSERYKDSAVPEPTRPYRYTGRRPGWVPGLLIIAGLLLLGGGAAYMFLVPAPIDNSVVSVPVSVVPARPVPVEPEPVAIVADTTMLADPADPAEPSVSEEETIVVPQVFESVENSEPVESSEPAPPVETALPSVDDFIAEWTASWQRQDVGAYLAQYHPDFTPPQGLTLEAWQQQRRRIIANAADLMIEAQSPEFTGETADGMLVRFWLNYRAANYADRTLKELVLVPVEGDWRIRAETNLRTERD